MIEEGEILWAKTNNGKTLKYHKEPYSNWWDRFTNGIMSLLPVESQL